MPVAGGTFGKQLSVGQVSQNHGHRGCTDVDGAANDGGVIRPTDLHAPEHIAGQFTLDTHSEVVLPERGSQLYHDSERNFHLIHTQCFLNRPDQPLYIGHGIVQSRLRHGKHHGAEMIGEGNSTGFQARLGIFKNGNLLWAGQVGGFHAALVGGGDVRYQNSAVAGHLGAAA